MEFARAAKPASDCSSRAPESNPIDLIALFDLDDAAFRARFRHTPLWRPKRRGLLRNAAIVLGNRPTPAAVPALVRGLNDEEPLVRGAGAWALGRYDDPAAAAALDSAACDRSKMPTSAVKSTLRSLRAALTHNHAGDQN